MMPERIATYIRNLDERIAGGIPKKHLVLVSGPQGTMKSSLCFYILYNQAKRHGLKSLYLAFEQRRESILSQMHALGMAHSAVEDKLFVVDLADLRRKVKTEEERKKWLFWIFSQVKTIKESENIELVTLDSLNALGHMTPTPPTRDELFSFFDWLRDLNLTAFIITETKMGDYLLDYFGGETFISDSVIHLDLERDKRTLNLVIGVIKMRETAIERMYFPLIFKDGQFAIMLQ